MLKALLDLTVFLGVKSPSWQVLASKRR